MPKHDVYIETHLGAGNILRRKQPASNDIGTEIDPEVIRSHKHLYASHAEICNEDCIAFLEERQFSRSTLVYAESALPGVYFALTSQLLQVRILRR